MVGGDASFEPSPLRYHPIRNCLEAWVNYADRGLLTDLRHALLHLHKTLLDWERTAYERIHGRTTGNALLQAIMKDPQFAWLHPMSGLIVTIDETLENEAPDAAADIAGILAQARTLVSPDESGSGYAQRYDQALQDSPDAVFAHRDVMTLLKSRKDEVTPSQRLH
jgi:hypothetical protein